MGPFLIRRVVLPHNDVGNHNGWYSVVRGGMITRRMALQVLLRGPVRARIEHVQTQDPEALPVAPQFPRPNMEQKG